MRPTSFVSALVLALSFLLFASPSQAQTGIFTVKVLVEDPSKFDGEVGTFVKGVVVDVESTIEKGTSTYRTLVYVAPIVPGSGTVGERAIATKLLYPLPPLAVAVGDPVDIVGKVRKSGLCRTTYYVDSAELHKREEKVELPPGYNWSKVKGETRPCFPIGVLTGAGIFAASRFSSSIPVPSPAPGSSPATNPSPVSGSQ